MYTPKIFYSWTSLPLMRRNAGRRRATLASIWENVQRYSIGRSAVTARPAAAVRAVVLPRLVVAAAARQRGFKRKKTSILLIIGNALKLYQRCGGGVARWRVLWRGKVV